MRVRTEPLVMIYALIIDGRSDDLDLILRILGDRFKPGPPLRRNPNELVKVCRVAQVMCYFSS